MARILVCEDEQIVALDIKRQLELFAHAVAGIYPSGEEAIAACEAKNDTEEAVNLVLMDIRLRGTIDGIEASRIIYERFSIPVILLTAFNDEATIARARDSQPFGYLLKPFEERELRTTIDIALYRHSLETRLRTSEERYRSLFENAPNANVTTDTCGAVLEYNQAFVQMLGADSAQSLEGKVLSGMFADRSAGLDALSRAVSGAVSGPEEWTLLRLDGNPVYTLSTVSRLDDSQGRPVELRWSLVDVSIRRELEQQLQQSQKMEAIGRLAGGIAHDFNNIITAIMGYCNLMAEDIPDDNRLVEELSGIQTAAKKAINLTRQLLTFSRKQAFEPKLVDGNAAILDMEKMLRRLVSETISIKYYTEAKRPHISIDQGQFEQLIINLVVNAKDAIAENGAIIIETWNTHSEGGASAHNIPKGDWFVLAVRDNGSGIEREHLQRIFEPFFTTKGVEKGTGMGLSTVYAIVNRHGGRITVESEKGKGTSFFIYLPLASGKLEALVEKAPPERIPRGNAGAVLVAEDDDYLRTLLSRILIKSGYTVHEAANPGEAIIIAEREKDFILLSDVVMPRMNGYELADRLVSMHRDLKVLFMSGYHDANVEREIAARPWSRFIQKPFTQVQLMNALTELVKEEPARLV